jgi:alpha-ribazole phosphatase
VSGSALYLMRHGEPVLAGLMLGRTDIAATEAGIAACRDQARELEVAHLLSSDLLRARQCAGAIGEAVIDPRWRELDFGDWDGLAPGAIDPAALGRFWEDPDAFPPPGGESWSALVGRVGAAIAALPPEPTLVVTHGGPMRAALHLLCGFDRKQVWAFDLPYAAVLGFHRWEGGAQIAGLWP